jgi:DNA polymerase-3 subunit gamma/tau
MSYIVLARRLRPQQFNEIIGQQHVSKTLENAIESGRIAHSYIFSGPRGVGKTTTARILAKALNCEKGPTAKPCDHCSNCESIIKSNSLDVLEIDGASNRGIDEIRNLRENIRFTPSQGKYRIYIIDEVHMLTKEAFNALLKTLEEPPEHAIFIFATTEIHRVPATILSRCQRFDFKRIPIKIMIDHLKSICQKEQIKIEPDALLHIAKKADGSMRDSQGILDQIISYSGKKITVDQVANVLGIIDQELYFDFSDKIHKKDTKELLLLAQKINTEGFDLGEFLVGFEEHYRNMLLAKTLKTVELINTSEYYQKKYLEESENFSETDLLRHIQLIGELQNSIKWCSQPYMKFELAILKMAKMPTTVEIETLLEHIELIKKKREPTNQKDNIAIPSKNQSELNINKIKQYWNYLIQQFRETKVNLANALECGRPVKLEDSLLTVEFQTVDIFHLNWLIKNKHLIEEKLYQKFNRHIKIKTKKVKTDTDNNKNAQGPPNAGKDIKKISQNDPILNKLIDELGLELT